MTAALSPVPKFNRPSEDTYSYIDSISDAAVKFQQITFVPASVTIAQAILESGWGKTTLAKDSNNSFGIKADGGVEGV